MRRPLFLPTARQTNWLLIVGFLAVGEAMYLRFMAIENSNVALACQAGLKTWLCSTYRLSDRAVQSPGVRRGGAGGGAPQSACGRRSCWSRLALAAAGFGLVLHNVDLSALAVGVLILSLARPAPAPE